MYYLYMLLGLVFVLASSMFIIKFFLKNEESYDNKKIFPKDATTIITFLVCIIAYIVSFNNIYVDIKTYILLILYISMLFITSYIDLRTKYIYDAILIVYGILFLILVFMIDNFDIKVSLMSMFIGGAFYGIIYIISKIIYKREAFGQGDIILVAVSSMFFTPLNTVISAFLSFYYAALFIIIMLIFGKKMDKMSEVPFGPYICLASVTVLNYGDLILNTIRNLF